MLVQSTTSYEKIVEYNKEIQYSKKSIFNIIKISFLVLFCIACFIICIIEKEWVMSIVSFFILFCLGFYLFYLFYSYKNSLRLLKEQYVQNRSAFDIVIHLTFKDQTVTIENKEIPYIEILKAYETKHYLSIFIDENYSYLMDKRQNINEFNTLTKQLKKTLKKKYIKF